MNSYGDPSSARGRARFPGPDGDSGPAADGAWSAGGGSNPPGAAAPSGRASVGSASVSPAPPGRAHVRRAVVPGPADHADGFGRGSGRASGAAAVGGGAMGAAGPPAAGRATVGRAAVRPISPGAAGAGPGGHGPGGPGGPGGPRGRGGRGRGNDPAALRTAKRRKRINLIIASFAVFIMLAGAGVVGFTYYSTRVVLPDQLDLPFASTVYAADGKTEIARLGEFNRTFVKIDQIPDYVQKAVVSAEDRKFYEHSGIDYAGIARAAWNNFTGGSKQGASTITQQYARNAFDNLEGVTYARKVREAVLASKLNDKYDKNTIMQHYLNTIYFGRGAYGVEAAAQAYFKTPVGKLNVGQAAVLAALIKQPVPDKVTGHKGYDPGENLAAAQDRWNYVLDGMVQKGWLANDKRPTEYPKVQPLPKDGACFIDCGINKPTGNVINYVRDEFVQMKICESADTCVKQIKDGGYRITTSINPKMQAAAEAAAWRARTDSELAGQPANLMAALVAVNPENGRVLAYFGGDNGTGHDFAGKNFEGGVWTGGHPPGSSFKVYTLAAALHEDISLESHWDGMSFTVPGTKIRVSNAGKDASCKTWCTLRQSTLRSYNVPFYHITEKIGPAKVVDMAKAAGVTMMWNSADQKAYDLTKVSGEQVAPKPFFNVVGYGQYPITVLDHANGLATLANRGKYYKAHFVVKVEQKNTETGQWEKVNGEQLKPQQRIRTEVADDVNAVLQKYPAQNGDALSGGRPATGKTGTWELNEKSSDNAHAWMIGATPKIATAVWVGNKGDQQAIKTKSGQKISGANLPADIWKRFMNEAHKGMEIDRFAEGKGIGDPDAGNGKSPSPSAPPGQCMDPTGLFCPQPGAPGGGNGRDGGGGGGAGGLGILPTPPPTTTRE